MGTLSWICLQLCGRLYHWGRKGRGGGWGERAENQARKGNCREEKGKDGEQQLGDDYDSQVASHTVLAHSSLTHSHLNHCRWKCGAQSARLFPWNQIAYSWSMSEWIIQTAIDNVCWTVCFVYFPFAETIQAKTEQFWVIPASSENKNWPCPGCVDIHHSETQQ